MTGQIEKVHESYDTAKAFVDGASEVIMSLGLGMQAEIVCLDGEDAGKSIQGIGYPGLQGKIKTINQNISSLWATIKKHQEKNEE